MDKKSDIRDFVRGLLSRPKQIESSDKPATKRGIPKEAIFYLIKELRKYLSLMESQVKGKKDEGRNEALKVISEVKEVIQLLESSIPKNDTGLFMKAMMKLRNLDLYIMFDEEEFKNAPMVRFWESVIEKLKDDRMSLIDLRDLLELEWQKLILGVNIIQELIQLETDKEFKSMVEEISRDAFRHYFFALNALTRYLKERDKKLLEGIMDDIYYSCWFMMKLRDVLPSELEEEIEKLITDERYISDEGY